MRHTTLKLKRYKDEKDIVPTLKAFIFSLNNPGSLIACIELFLDLELT